MPRPYGAATVLTSEQVGALRTESFYGSNAKSATLPGSWKDGVPNRRLVIALDVECHDFVESGLADAAGGEKLFAR